MRVYKLGLTWVDGPCPLLSSDLRCGSDSPGHPWSQRVHHQICVRRCHPSLGHPRLLPANLVLHSGHKVPSFPGWSGPHRQSWFLWTVLKKNNNKLINTHTKTVTGHFNWHGDATEVSVWGLKWLTQFAQFPHILIWEPFCEGHCGNSPAQDLVRFSLIFHLSYGGNKSNYIPEQSMLKVAIYLYKGKANNHMPSQHPR